MKKLFFVTIMIWLFASTSSAQAVEDELINLIQQERYRELVNKICALREKEYYKNAFMDYCLAYSYCRLNKPSVAGHWFDHILASYNNLSTSKRQELRNQKQSCVVPVRTAGSTSKMFEFLNSMSGENFEGNTTGVESKMGIPSLRDTVKEFDFEHLTFDTQKRKFSLEQKREALLYYKDLIGDTRLEADTTAHFVVFYPKNALSIKGHMKQLEEYHDYYRSAFNLGESNRLIIVIYCVDRSDFNRVADSIHNIPVPKSTFGYASSVDLVMMGIANAFWLGALKHELFHLMIRSFIGDIPPWLDEGTACFFESSRISNNKVTTNFSGGNYRVNLLREIKHVKEQLSHASHKEEFVTPTLERLVNFNWQEFSGRSGDLTIKASYHQSLSYAFVTFLDEMNLLGKIIAAYRNRSYIEATAEESQDGVTVLRLRSHDEILRNVTGKEVQQIQSEFSEWCRRKYIIL